MDMKKRILCALLSIAACSVHAETPSDHSPEEATPDAPQVTETVDVAAEEPPKEPPKPRTQAEKPYVFAPAIEPEEEDNEPGNWPFSYALNGLNDNISFKLIGVYNQYMRTNPRDPKSKNFTWGNVLEINSFAYAKEHYLKFDAFLAYSNLKNAFQGAFSDPGNRTGRNHYIDFKELYYQYQGSKADILVGRDMVEKGVGDMYTMAGTYNTYNSGVDLYLIELGAWQARVDYYLENGDKFSTSILPFEEKPTQSPKHTRWGNDTEASSLVPIFTGSFEALFSPFYTIKNRTRSEALHNWNYIFRYDTTRDGADMFAEMRIGRLPSQVLKVDNINNPRVLTVEYPRGVVFVAGYIRTINAWKLYTEAMYQDARHQEDTDYYQAMAGASYKETKIAHKLGLEAITPNIEITYEDNVRKQDASRFFSDSVPVRPIKKDIIFKIKFDRNHEWNYYIAADYDYKEYGRAAAIAAEYSPTDNLTLTALGAMISGPSDSVLGIYRDNDFVQAKFEYSF